MYCGCVCGCVSVRTCNNGWSIFFHLAPYPHKFLLQVVSMVGVAVHKQLHWLIKAQASQLLNLGAGGGGGGGGGQTTTVNKLHQSCCYLSIAYSRSIILFVALLHLCVWYAHIICHCSREEHGLSSHWTQLDNLVHLVHEVFIKHSGVQKGGL